MWFKKISMILNEVNGGLLLRKRDRTKADHFNKVEHSRLVAVMRRNAEKAADYPTTGVPKWYSDADSAYQDPEVNAVYIATPPAHMPNML
jgi:predicted dehydrogenase